MKIDLNPAYDQLVTEVCSCPKCPLSRTRNKAVPGEGPLDAELMFIGEAPGWHENQQGRPFVGPAGQFLEQLLRSIGLTRQQVYITNVVKCRPPNNRDPMPNEIAACADYLDRQIAIIRPKVIVTLGRYSMAKFFPGQTISRIHGTHRQVTTAGGSVYAFAMYHPAAALHQATLRPVVEADMLKLPAVLEKARAAAVAAAAAAAVATAPANGQPANGTATPPTEDEPVPPKQLSLFE